MSPPKTVSLVVVVIPPTVGVGPKRSQSNGKSSSIEAEAKQQKKSYPFFSHSNKL